MSYVGCAGKTGYPTPQAAQKHMPKKRQTGSRRLSVYRCRDCGLFHIGSHLGPDNVGKQIKKNKQQKEYV